MVQFYPLNMNSEFFLERNCCPVSKYRFLSPLLLSEHDGWFAARILLPTTFQKTNPSLLKAQVYSASQAMVLRHPWSYHPFTSDPMFYYTGAARSAVLLLTIMHERSTYDECLLVLAASLANKRPLYFHSRILFPFRHCRRSSLHGVDVG